MNDRDQSFALILAYHAMSKLQDQCHDLHIIGICSLLHEKFEEKYTLVGQEMYQEMYRLFLSYECNAIVP